jgi:hypothetical protein
MANRRLQAFISSKMVELKPERDIIKESLEGLKVDAWVYEEDVNASSQTIQETFLEEVENADIYIGIFWKGFGAYTIEEFEHARKLRKPQFVYVKNLDLDKYDEISKLDKRDFQLQEFLDTISDVETGVTSVWFDETKEIGTRSVG